jgi:hypothetical protein
MIVINVKVLHRTFGGGTVIAQEGNIITVRFSDKYGDRRFQYPAAFTSFLALSDPALRDGVEAEIKLLHRAERLARKKREEETEKKREAERIVQLEAKRTVVKRKAPAR